jgi:hypothetical protein
MILTPNYSLKRPEPADNLAASQDFLSDSFSIIDTRLKADADGITSNTATLVTKADKLSPTFTPNSVGAVGVSVVGLLGQTADLFQARNSAGLVLTKIDNAGNFVAPAIAAGGFIPVDSASHVIPLNAGQRGLTVRGVSGQTANLAEFQNSAGTVLASIDQSGLVYARDGVKVGAGNLGQAYMEVNNATLPGVKGLVVRGAASQTANLAEFQNSAGTVLAGFSADGTLIATGVNSGSAVAGGASALPGNPVGYMNFVFQGTTRRVPYYAT